MPIYEYKCRKGHVFDVMQRMSDDPLNRCEVCGAVASRVLHPPAVHFKGSGFYNTDYGTRRRSREGKEGEGGSGSEAGETKQGESKTADSKSGESKSGAAKKSESSTSAAAAS